MLTLILGGARSGKSLLAQRLAERSGRVVYVATAEFEADAEMLARIEQHRRDRPSSWRTVEEPVELASAIEPRVQEFDAVIADCLTVWLSNVFWRFRNGSQEQIEDCVRGQLGRIQQASRRCHVILVSNEVGCGTVPEAELTRAFRDAQGRLNQYAAELADEVILTIAGLPLYLKAAQSGAIE